MSVNFPGLTAILKLMRGIREGVRQSRIHLQGVLDSQLRPVEFVFRLLRLPLALLASGSKKSVEIAGKERARVLAAHHHEFTRRDFFTQQT